MSTTHRAQPTSLDTLTLAGLPVVLGGPSLRRAGEQDRPRLRRPGTAKASSLQSSTRERLRTPR